MQKAHLNYIKHALEAGHTVSVHDGEEWAVKRSTAYTAIKDAAEAVEEGVLQVRDKDGEYLGRAWFIFDFDQAPDEIIYNYTITDYNEAWWDKYFEE